MQFPPLPSSLLIQGMGLIKIKLIHYHLLTDVEKPINFLNFASPNAVYQTDMLTLANKNAKLIAED